MILGSESLAPMVRSLRGANRARLHVGRVLAHPSRRAAPGDDLRRDARAVAADLAREVADVDRLLEVAREAGREQPLLVASGLERAESDDWDLGRSRVASELARRGVRASADYAAFWDKLRAGNYQAAQYRRLAKGGREIWIEASYNPILDAVGRPYKVVKFATDITAQVTLLNELRRLIAQNFGEIDGALLRSDTQARAASEAAGSTADNVQTMAAASEELAASVAERGVVVAGTDDPYCPEGAEHAYARPLDLDFVPVEGGGHLTIDDGYGPFPLVLDLATR